MDWMAVSLQNSQAEIQTPKVLVLGRGVFGKWLGQEGETFMNGTSAPIKEIKRALSTLGKDSRSVYKPGRGSPQTSIL